MNAREDFFTIPPTYNGVASNIITLLLHGEIFLSNIHGSISWPTILYQEGEKTVWILHVAFAAGGNRTQGAFAASECAIQYSVASRHQGRN